MERPGWIAYFLGVAEAISKRGECTRSQVGAVIVDMPYREIVATGYNGVDQGKPSCLDGACPRGALSYDQYPPGGSYDNCVARHAEENAIRWLFKNHDPGTLKLHWVFVTRKPCENCLRLIEGYGFHVVVWPEGHQVF